MSDIRTLAISLLDDDDGIDQNSYDLLLGMMLDSGDCGDIIPYVEATDNRFYLLSGWNDAPNEKPRYRVTLLISTDNGNPAKWEWSDLIDESDVALVSVWTFIRPNSKRHPVGKHT